MTLQHTIVRDPATGRLDSRNPLGQSDPVPTQVQNVQQTGSTSSSVTLSWDAATDAETYSVYVDSIDTPTLTGLLNLNATVSGLTAETGYTIRVSATNSIGEGDLSDPVTMTTSAASAGTRNRQLHPFPAEDPFNMPMGLDAWYAPTSDPATSRVRSFGGAVSANTWSHPVYLATEADPIVQICDRRTTSNGVIQSVLPEEEGEECLFEHVPVDAMEASGSYNPTWDQVRSDGVLHVISGEYVVENYKWERDVDDPDAVATTTRTVRNRLSNYSFSYHPSLTGPNPLAARSGIRTVNMCALGGLIRRHEVDPSDPDYIGEPYIPHAIAAALHGLYQAGPSGTGDPGSPFYNTRDIFPATTTFYSNVPNDIDPNNIAPLRSCRGGMRFAMDPTIVTDDYLNAISDDWERAVVRALRDYGMFAVEWAHSYNVLYAQALVLPSAIVESMRGWGAHAQHLRRVAGRVSPGGSPVHIPTESQWDTWRANGEGWGGGAPRVPYSDPLADL